MPTPQLKVVILAAAQRPGIDLAGPRAMQRLGEKTILDHVLELAQQIVPPQDIYLVVGYQHEVIRTDGQEGTDPLPRVHRVVSLLQRWMLGTHQGAIRASHLDYYLDEFTFRFNRRTSRSRGKLFYRLVQQAVAVDPVPQQQLRGATTNVSSPAHGPT